MGQQQLLLLVLGIVIVGLAVVVGIQAFSENMKKTNADALVNDAIRIAADAQAWKLKPAAFGGGSSATNWTGLDFGQIGYPDGEQGLNPHLAIAGEYENLNGVYALSGQATTDLVVTAYGYEADGTTVLNTVTVTIDGTSSADIPTEIN